MSRPRPKSSRWTSATARTKKALSAEPCKAVHAISLRPAHLMHRTQKIGHFLRFIRIK